MRYSGLALVLLVAAGLVPARGFAQRGPIIDVHLHAQELWTDDSINGLSAATSTEDLQSATLAALAEYDIVMAVASGPYSEAYRAAAKDRIILASPFLTGPEIPPDSLRTWFESGRYQALAEFAPQYSGLPPNSPALEPYFALAEELDVPLGIHVGLGPPGAAYRGSPKFRMAHGNPLLLEDVLIKHPKLRLYVMHAGWPFLDEMIALLHAHPQVYVDVAVIDWWLPRAEFYSYLRRLVEAGFGDRIMFGSDQMVWPGAIGRAVENIEAAPFLTDELKRNIFYNNAARFFRIRKHAGSRN